MRPDLGAADHERCPTGRQRRHPGAYNGHPLYYFAGDSKPGDVTGEGNTSFGAGWDVVSPAGAKIAPGG